MEGWRSGDHIIVRDVWQGAVLNARPVTVYASPDFTERHQGFELLDGWDVP